MHGQPTVPDVDLHAHPTEAPLGVGRQDPILLGIHEGAVRVERLDHPADRAVDQLVLIRLLDVHGLDVTEGPREDREVGVGRGAALGGERPLDGAQGERGHERTCESGQDQCGATGTK